VSAPDAQSAPPPLGRQRIQVRSSIDGTFQDSYLIVPGSHNERTAPRPLLVLLHTWSADLEQRQPAVEAEAAAREWLLLIPNFRGPNDRPEACGSTIAQQDILDAVAWVKGRFAVDDARIYLLGLSGGGHMAMLMAARTPQTWAAASAWVGVSDLTAWYDEHRDDDYAGMLRACFGGNPTDNSRVAGLYRDRSPLTHLRPGLDLPIELGAGSKDPLVSVEHSLRAFEALVPGGLSPADRVRLRGGADSDEPYGTDPLIGRRIVLRRTVGEVRLTIFDGEHEWFPESAIEWLAQHDRR
jgi:dipeptidyl aminopeptidase/acylaminoacyl peptidase